MNPSSVDIPLHDIKPLVEIEDYSFWMLNGLIIAGVLLLAALLFLLWRYLKERHRYNHRKVCFKALESVSFANSKVAAYAVSRHGLCFADDSDRVKEAYYNLVSKLEPYKYKKEVEKIDDEVISYYHIYIGMIDV